MERHEASHYRKLKAMAVQCQLCPQQCVITRGSYGFCNARKNVSGTLYSMVYGKPSSIAVDPIEKKPLYHFLPGQPALSLGTIGCNLACRHCQNWSMSRASPSELPAGEHSPQEIIALAKENNCPLIAYTYNEPTVFFEYMLDIAKLARTEGIKNVMVSNGFINPGPLHELCHYLDGANIDLKAFDDAFYRMVCRGSLEPVLESLRILHKHKVWLEITTLIIPGKNDDLGKIGKMCRWIIGNLGPDVPLHFTAFYPCYQMLDVPATGPGILEEARRIALAAGLHYVYLGNLSSDEGSITQCPRCHRPLIERSGFAVVKNKVAGSACPCGEPLAGVFR